MFAILVVFRTHSAAIAVSQVQPDCPIWAQYLANPAEHLDQLRDVLLRCRLQPDLPFDAVVPKAEVGWRRDHALHRLRRQDVSYAFGLVAVDNGHLRPLLLENHTRTPAKLAPVRVMPVLSESVVVSHASATRARSLHDLRLLRPPPIVHISRPGRRFDELAPQRVRLVVRHQVVGYDQHSVADVLDAGVRHRWTPPRLRL